MIEFGRDICTNILLSSQKEWLVTNGIGGFAAGTVSGVLTRRYHGLLIAALQPPLGRTLLVTKIEETAYYAGKPYPLYADRWADGSVHPTGYLHIERFYLDRSIPVWEYGLDDPLVEKRIWMIPGENTTCVRYALLKPGNTPVSLVLRVLVNSRDYHGITQANASETPSIQVQSDSRGLQVQAANLQHTYYIHANGAQVECDVDWQPAYYLSAEAARGESPIEDHLAAGNFRIDLEPGHPVTVILSSEKRVAVDGESLLQVYRDHESEILTRANYLLTNSRTDEQAVEQLVLAADQFIVHRPTRSDPQGQTILAGYPWFSDWGRDTMISLPGLTLATGRPETARKILRTFAAYVDQGMLPNRFPDQGEVPEYNTADATLWFFEAVCTYYTNTADIDLLGELFPTLKEIIRWHLQGTRYQIHCDLRDGLLYAGEQNSQLTWMDVRIDGWAVTPRIGKPVEINALWYNALCSLADIANLLGQPGEAYQHAAQKALKGFKRFWNPKKRCLFDVLDGPTGDDASVRPNQLFAVSLHHSPLSEKLQKLVVDRCTQSLLTTFGLRTLAQDEPGYIGHYGGDRWQRDTAYHQGTVWAWLIGPLVSAHLRVYKDPELAWSFLHPLLVHLSEYGLGSISELFDGDPPHKPNGCPAQAWSVAEVLRSIQEIQQFMAQLQG